MSAPDLADLARPVRHEANNLLAALGGTLELMRRAATEERALERIARMTEATARLEALFKAYLALAAPAAPDPDGTDAPRVLAQLQPLLVLLLGPGRPLEIEAPPRLRRIAMPPEELQPLVLDLARRAAARVAPPGGLRIVLEAAAGGLALRAEPLPPAQGAAPPAIRLPSAG